MAIVIDASVLAFALLSATPEHGMLRRRLAGEVCHAPHLIDAEIGNVLRRRVLRAEIMASTAEELLLRAAPLIDFRHAMVGPIARAAWSLRENMTFYDAVYVALAQALSVPLLTADGRLARVPRLPCAVELITS